MGQTTEPDISKLLDELPDGVDEPFSYPEIRTVVENVLSTLDGDLSGQDIKMYAEIEGLAQLIETTKQELAALRPQEISDEHIAVATDELDAVVAATEEATNAIMSAAEEIESLAESVGGEHEATLIDATTRIFVACGFQDITGQRITKVVTALKEIESKISTMIDAFGDNEERRNRAKKKITQNSNPDSVVPERPERDLLQGPQLPGNANNQDDIDALFDKLG